MPRTSSVILTCVLLLGCAGQAPPARVPEPQPSAAPAPAPPAPRKPTADVTRFWGFPSAPPVAVYADLASLFATELMRSLVPELIRLGFEQNASEGRACIAALTEHAHELLLGGDQRDGLLALSLGEDGVKAVRGACVGTLVTPESTAIPGADEAYAAGQIGVAAVKAGTVLVGPRSMVEAALAPQGKAAPLPGELSLKGDERAAFVVDMAGVRADGNLTASPSLFAVNARIALPGEAVATQLEQQLVSGRGRISSLSPGPEAAELERVLRGFRVERQGRELRVALELTGAPAQQAKDLGLLTSLAIFGAQRYMQGAKAAEAKVTLARITKSYQLALTGPGGASTKKLKKLVSLPAVPAAVPRGVEHQSSAADWKGWEPISFVFDGPQRYQYEVVAAKDGKSAEVRARGDLDGDGVTSSYVLKIVLDPSSGQITAQGLDETEPLE